MIASQHAPLLPFTNDHHHDCSSQGSKLSVLARTILPRTKGRGSCGEVGAAAAARTEAGTSVVAVARTVAGTSAAASRTAAGTSAAAAAARRPAGTWAAAEAPRAGDGGIGIGGGGGARRARAPRTPAAAEACLAAAEAVGAAAGCARPSRDRRRGPSGTLAGHKTWQHFRTNTAISDAGRSTFLGFEMK